MQTHIDSCAACQEVLEGLVAGVTGPLDVLGSLSDLNRHADMTSPASTAAVQSAQTFELPGYEVLGILGRGGMGVVYKARQVRPARLVALKVLLAGGHASPKDKKRFLREAGAVAQLQHPYIVSLYEVGEHGELPYLTLEYIAGGSLADLLRRTPLSPQDAARLVEQVARAAHYAHERGIVHRDLKPANVLLAQGSEGIERTKGVAADSCLLTPDSYYPKITDFGLAKNIAAGADLTTGNAVCGTPSYMAPEQARGLAEAISASADIYALGAILYECLTSRPPFRGPTPADTLLQVMDEDPVPPKRLQPTVPPDLQTICLKCLEKKPSKRYASALDLANDLQRFQAGEAIHARPVGRWERLVKWCRRRPTVAALLAALVLLIVIAGALVTWQWREAVAALAEARNEKAARLSRQVAALPDAAPGSVPPILEELGANLDEVLPILRERFQQEKEPLRRMRLALALLPVDPDAVRGPLTEWLLQAEDPAEVLLVRQALLPHQDELKPRLWAAAEDKHQPVETRFRAWVALAAYDPNDDRWGKLAPLAAERVLWSNPLHRGQWTEALRPLGHNLSGTLTEASYFPLKTGIQWHYTMVGKDKKLPIIQRIAKVENIDGQPLARLEAETESKVLASEHLNSTAQGLYRHRFNGSDISPPIRLLSFPIRFGETSETEHTSGGQRFKVITKVGSDEIEVPAGKFKTVTVRLEMVAKEGIYISTYWYAAGVGLVKQNFLEDGKETFSMSLDKVEKAAEGSNPPP